MITTWKVRNFKCITDAELDLAPLTIIAGSNSSGKSTLLQSILLVAQSLSSQNKSPTFLLNQSMVRLGRFDDIKSKDRNNGSIEIGWNAEPRESENSHINSSIGTRRRYRWKRWLQSVDCKVKIEAVSSISMPENPQLQPKVIYSKIQSTMLGSHYRTSNQQPKTYTLEISHRPNNNEATKRWLEETPKDEPDIHESIKYSVYSNDNSQNEINDTFGDGVKVIGCKLHGMLPSALVIRLNLAKWQVGYLKSLLHPSRESLSKRGWSKRGTFLNVLDHFSLHPDLIAFLAEQLGEQEWKNHFPDRDFGSDSLSGVSKQELSLDTWSFERLVRKCMRYMRSTDEAYNKLLKYASSIDYERAETAISLESNRPESISTSTGYINQFFSSSVKYLGPLRDEPKSYYPKFFARDSTDVGLRGERTAEVLQLHWNSPVSYIRSDDFLSRQSSAVVTQVSLNEAIIDWLGYFGLAVNISTHDGGILGNKIEVAVAKNQVGCDLMHVGVGVSQVLPILVFCLLSKSDTLLIVEQPELHLHPATQARLADFFLSLTLTNKQCIIETHSEYLTNRIRFRAAINRTTPNPITDRLRIYFARLAGGRSEFRPIEVNEYGAISNWPDGFFDQSEHESENILRAAYEKFSRREQ